MKKDLILFGALAGAVGNVPKIILGWAFHFMGVLRYTFEHIAAGLFVPAEFLDNPVSLSMGFFSDWVIAGFLGTITLLLIRQTGGRYPIVKSLFVSALGYIFIFGALMALDVTRASLVTPLPNLILLFPHLLYGFFVGWFIKKYDAVPI